MCSAPGQKQTEPPAPPTAPAGAGGLSAGKKIVFSLIALCLFFLACELVLWLLGVRSVLLEEDPYVGFSGRIPLFVERRRPNGAAAMATATNKLRFFNPQEFPREKGRNVRRIFCMGGSTTYGRPYDDRTSFCGYLRALLARADPSRKWEVINAGGLSYASYRVASLMEELSRYEPDLFVIYCGHNEFLEKRTYANIAETPAFVRELGALLSGTRTYAAVKRGIDAVRGPPDTPPADRAVLPGEVEAILDRAAGLALYHRDDELQKNVLRHYRHNLGRMIDVARAAGAKVILIVPAANLRDFSPFKSQHREGLLLEQRRRWRVLLDRAERARAKGEPEEALAALDEAAGIDDRHADLHYRRGCVLYDLKAYRQAKAAFQRAIDEDVCPLRALSAMPEIVREVATDRKVPLVDFAGLVEVRSEHGIAGQEQFFDHVHPRLALHCELAVAILERMREAGMVDPAPTWNAAAVEQVAAEVQKQKDPKADALALLNLSKVLGWAGKYEESARLAREALKLNPQDAEAHYNLGVTLQWLGRNEEAVAPFREALKLRPQYTGALNGLGCALMYLNRLDEAADCVQRAIRLEPNEAESYFGLAEIRMRQKRAPDAIELYGKALELDAQLDRAHGGLARALIAQSRPVEALVHAQKAVEMDPRNARHRFVRASALLATDQLSSAVAEYQKALEIEPSHLGALNNLAWLLATRASLAGQEALAMELAERACAVAGGGRPDLLDTLAAAYAAAGQFDSAVATAKRAIELAESSGKAPMAEEIRARLRLYQNGQAYRETP